MQTTKNEKEVLLSNDMQDAFYVEELEERLEMAGSPNIACWITNL